MEDQAETTDDYRERLLEIMEAAPRRPEPPLTNDELRWFRRFRKDREHRLWLRKQVFVLAPIITTVVVSAIAAWKWIAPFINFTGGK